MKLKFEFDQLDTCTKCSFFVDGNVNAHQIHSVPI